MYTQFLVYCSMIFGACQHHIEFSGYFGSAKAVSDTTTKTRLQLSVLVSVVYL